MSLQSTLASAGAFASRKPIPKTVNLPTAEGEIEVQLHFLDLPAAEVRDLLDNDGTTETVAAFVCATLCEPDGSPALQMDGEHGARSLKIKTLNALSKAALEALGLNAKAKDEAKKG